MVPDEGGYPPVDTEGIWAIPLQDGLYRIQNVPFYACDLSRDDVVSVRYDDEQNLWFDKLMTASSNSTFRVIVHDASQLELLRKRSSALGCETEVNRKQRLIAIDILSSVRIEPLLNHLMSLRDQKIADLEEGALRHPLNDAIQEI